MVMTSQLTETKYDVSKFRAEVEFLLYYVEIIRAIA